MKQLDREETTEFQIAQITFYRSPLFFFKLFTDININDARSSISLFTYFIYLTSLHEVKQKKQQDINNATCSGGDKGCKISNLSPIN
jgi:hypothetical protein